LDRTESEELVHIYRLEDPAGRDGNKMASWIAKTFWLAELNPAPTGSDDAPTSRKHVPHPLTFAVGERKEVATLCPEDVDRRLICVTRTPAEML
jgi:hypothetical protein